MGAIDTLNMIKDFSLAFGVSGFEDDVLEVAKKYMPEGYTSYRDSMLNFFMMRENDTNSTKPTVLLDAHSDEIGLIVQAVKKNGTITFNTLGGWVPASLYAQKMAIKNTDGQIITGVIASTMPHFGGGKDTAPAIETMTLDIGASSGTEVIEDYKITCGCPVVPVADFEKRGDIMFSKAFDDRLGCAAVMDVLNKLKNVGLPINIVGTLSSQEEVGLRGAKVVANRVKPDLVICFEGAPADDTLVAPDIIQTRLGKGPMLRHMDTSMITNPRYLKFVLDIAKKYNIPVQEAVRTGGGTNAGAFYTSNLGIPSVVIACPVRYAHSHNSIASFSDYKNSVDLAVNILEGLNSDKINSF